MNMRGLAAALALAPVLSFAAISVASAEDLVFMLDNQSSSDVKEFYTSPVNVKDWEANLLGDNVLAAKNFAKVTIADGRKECNYDLKFVFADDSTVEEDGINLCDTGSYTLTDK